MPNTTSLLLTDIPVEHVGAVLNAIRQCGFDLEVKLQPRARHTAAAPALLIDSRLPADELEAGTDD